MSAHSVYKDIISEQHLKVITNEFHRLKDVIYLDHAGATLYSAVQIDDVFDDYKSNVYANPHSRSIHSKLTEDAVDQIRYEILQLLNTNSEEYTMVFTSGATESLKLVAESFQYNDGIFAYLCDNHTSVLGMREYTDNIKPIDIKEAYYIFNNHPPKNGNNTSTKNNLFVYPAQSNFSGDKYPLEWIENVRGGCLTCINDGKWYTLLDAASYVSTSNLDLKLHKPDFVPISFYKIFGYPTGLGALLIKNSCDVLQKKYYGGGTVFLAQSSKNVVIRRSNLHERFEDGTISYLSILSLRHGLNTLKRLRLTMSIISEHVFYLAKYIYDRLLSLHHFNGTPVAILYNNSKCANSNEHGGIINFNLLRSNREFVGYAEVLNVSNLHNIQLRTGCFCNPGACQYHLGLTAEEVQSHYEQGHVCGDQNDLINGTPTGSVRISFGYMSTKSDADKLLQMVENCFVDKSLLKQEHLSRKQESTNNSTIECMTPGSKRIRGTLKEMYIYPIKSCAACPVNKWDITPTGFKYDRNWMIVNSSGVCITQKKCPYMCLIKPKIHAEKNTLELSFDALSSITIPLNAKNPNQTVILCQSKVCNDRIEGYDCGDNVSNWLYEALNTSGLRLIRQITHEEDENATVRSAKNDTNQQLSLANQAQFLLINSKSAEWLLHRLPENEVDSLGCLIKRFRPNFVVDFKEPFLENTRDTFTIANTTLLNDGPCTRCQMICINQATGEKSAELLLTLSKEFKGKMSFGVYLKFSKIINCDYFEIGSNVYIP